MREDRSGIAPAHPFDTVLLDGDSFRGKVFVNDILRAGSRSRLWTGSQGFLVELLVFGFEPILRKGPVCGSNSARTGPEIPWSSGDHASP